MSTRSWIGIVNEDKSVDYIYCHSDGYLDHNGVILNEHYQDEDKIRELIKHGNMSTLTPNIGQKHAFDDYEARKTDCTFYHRDRGEELSTNKSTLKDFRNDEIAYLFHNGRWVYRSYGEDTFQNLITALREAGCKWKP